MSCTQVPMGSPRRSLYVGRTSLARWYAVSTEPDDPRDRRVLDSRRSIEHSIAHAGSGEGIAGPVRPRRTRRFRALALPCSRMAGQPDAARCVENLERDINPWNGTGAALPETVWQHNGLVGGATPRSGALRWDKADCVRRKRRAQEAGRTSNSQVHTHLV